MRCPTDADVLLSRLSGSASKRVELKVSKLCDCPAEATAEGVKRVQTASDTCIRPRRYFKGDEHLFDAEDHRD